MAKKKGKRERKYCQLLNEFTIHSSAINRKY